VIGYLSAAVEWAHLGGDPKPGDSGGMPTSTRRPGSDNFIGKDNIPFHTILWPGMLIGYNAGATHLNLPYDVPANEIFEPGGDKFSTSRGNVIGWNSVLAQFQPDVALRPHCTGPRNRRCRVHLAGISRPGQQRTAPTGAIWSTAC
jgi:methionyl-tRNA synthetase